MRRPCVFCPNPRTSKRGEHVFDDWLNRQDGKTLRYHYQTTEYGRDDIPVREYSSRRLDTTKDVVCDECNHGWMSELTSESKRVLEGFIRLDQPASLLPEGILVTTCFSFMKAAVLDYAYEDARKPYVSHTDCLRFRRWLTGESAEPWLPPGLQVWLAWYKRGRQMETRVWVNGLQINVGPFRGWKVFLLTYVVGTLAIQVSLPRWTKTRKHNGVLPRFQQPEIWDGSSFPIWPDVTRATWPPPKHLDYAALDYFHQRLAKVRFTS